MFVITDSTVEALVIPRLSHIPEIANAPRFVLPPGEESKSPRYLIRIWQWLSQNGANRSSRILNIGGGMVSDIGGFAASTFMRGIPYSNLPTTLLAAVDAAIGGKTAVNLGELKNQAGAFAMPTEVIQMPELLSTLPKSELLSGLGEMLKYGLIASPSLYRAMLNPEPFLENTSLLAPYITECVAIKERIVAQDPTEKGIRKILNFGHTAGHAFESLALAKGTPIPHGIAVAHGLLVELILSHTILGFPSAELYPLAMTLKESFPSPATQCRDNEKLIQIMAHDKKNTQTLPSPKGAAGLSQVSLPSPQINFTLLKELATPEINQHPDPEEIATALDIYRDLTIA